MNNQLIRGNLFLFSKPEPESKQFEKGERFFLNQAGTTESLFIVLRVTKENQLILARAFPTQQKNTCKVIIGRKEYLNCTPFVRQYDIMSNRWGDFNAKGYTKQTIHTGI